MVQVSICVGSSCHLKGSYQIIKLFEQLIEDMDLEDDIELKASFCLGLCTKGVAITVANESLENVNVSNAKDIFLEKIVKRI